MLTLGYQALLGNPGLLLWRSRPAAQGNPWSWASLPGPLGVRHCACTVISTKDRPIEQVRDGRVRTTLEKDLVHITASRKPAQPCFCSQTPHRCRRTHARPAHRADSADWGLEKPARTSFPLPSAQGRPQQTAGLPLWPQMKPTGRIGTITLKT